MWLKPSDMGGGGKKMGKTKNPQRKRNPSHGQDLGYLFKKKRPGRKETKKKLKKQQDR